MKLLVGLGNPGTKYAGNRHNIGFMALDRIVQRHSFGPWRSKFTAQYCEGVIEGEKVIALKPETFMNESGRAVQAVARFYKVALADIIVLHDELDIAFAKLKVKTGGGHGGHNGLRSIDAHMGKEYQRIRLGIGHPGQKELVHSHVLGDFAKAQQSDLDKMLDVVAQHIDLVVLGKATDFMTKYAVALSPQRPNKPKPTAADPAAKASNPQAKATEQDDHPFAALGRLKKDLS